jgi:hypothetical protein
MKHILISSSHLRLGLKRCLILSDSTTKILYAFSISYMRIKRPALLIHLDLVTLIIFGGAYSHEPPHYVVFSSLPPLLHP